MKDLILNYIKQFYDVKLWLNDRTLISEVILDKENPLNPFHRFSKDNFHFLINKIFGKIDEETYNIINNWITEERHKTYGKIYKYLEDYRVILGHHEWYVVRKDNVHKPFYIRTMRKEIGWNEFDEDLVKHIFKSWKSDKVIEQTEINMKLGLI